MKNALKEAQERLKLFKKYGYDIPRARKFILAKAGINKGDILEVGTGRGHMTTVLANEGFKLTSIDLDRKAQKFAKADLKARKLDRLITFKIMNAERLRYKDNSFDCVVSVNFIHHAKNPKKCLKEMVRVAKGKLVIADINKKGERIMEKVHKLDGHSHPLSKMSLSGIAASLRKGGMKVRIYRDICQAVLIATKGASK